MYIFWVYQKLNFVKIYKLIYLVGIEVELDRIFFVKYFFLYC